LRAPTERADPAVLLVVGASVQSLYWTRRGTDGDGAMTAP
jgi:hypothetical protein